MIYQLAAVMVVVLVTVLALCAFNLRVIVPLITGLLDHE